MSRRTPHKYRTIPFPAPARIVEQTEQLVHQALACFELYRTVNALSVAEACQDVGIPTTYYSQIRNGTRPMQARDMIACFHLLGRDLTPTLADVSWANPAFGTIPPPSAYALPEVVDRITIPQRGPPRPRGKPKPQKKQIPSNIPGHLQHLRGTT